MKQLFLFFSMLIVACSLSSVAIAQQNNLMAKAQQYANEVFLNCNEQANPQNISGFAEVLSRIEVVTTESYNSNNYTLLSTVPLKDKCNPNLVRDNATNFNPDNFNPLKYQMNWYPKGTDHAYRVDNTNYIIIIHHVN